MKLEIFKCNVKTANVQSGRGMFNYYENMS